MCYNRFIGAWSESKFLKQNQKYISTFNSLPYQVRFSFYITMSFLPTIPTIPIPLTISKLFSHFPLITYDSPLTSIPAPSIPTLWLIGPPPPLLSSSTDSKVVLESLDPYSREIQCFVRFLNSDPLRVEAKIETEVRWMNKEFGVVGGKLPNLHLPDGSLLGRDEIGFKEYFKDPIKWRLNNGKPNNQITIEERTPSYQAFEVLIRTTLLPAVLALVYFSEKKSSSSSASSRNQFNSNSDLPYLSSWVAWYDSIIQKKERIDEVKLLRGANGLKAVLDLEEVERIGVETIEVLEVKFRDGGHNKEAWFDGADRATELDALIYSLLSLSLVLPGSLDSQLRRKLESSPTLMNWVKSKKP